MPIAIEELVAEIVPTKTVLLFGAGASLPSGAPSVRDLVDHIALRFNIENKSLGLADISAVAEARRSRRELIAAVREKFVGLRPKGALLNLPLYAWKSIYTTNYDDLVEQAYARAGLPIQTFRSDFDFTIHAEPLAQKLFKIHGSIEQDVADGHAAGMILTALDYDKTQDYREALFGRLQNDLAPDTQVVIVGQSLADPDLREVVQRAIAIRQKVGAGGKVHLLLYEQDKERAELFEMRGHRVAFGGLDGFFSELAKKAPIQASGLKDNNNAFDHAPGLRPTTIEVSDEADASKANPNAIFNGWPAQYADIEKGLTFERAVATDIAQYLQAPNTLCTVLMGASGVGKSTAARQAVLKLRRNGFVGWEHKSDHALNVADWTAVAEWLSSSNKRGVLFVDDAHSHLFELNELVDRLAGKGLEQLKLVLATTRNHWGPRVKSPTFFSRGQEFTLSQLANSEIESLLNLLDSSPEVKGLVESGFGGFSRNEKRRRLIERCEADMFVCMKNIFASEKYDDIILREYASLDEKNQEVYKLVSAMESLGIHVHRQLVMRVLGLQANYIASVLAGLEDIVSEYGISEREGIYGWRVRHGVIAAIIAKYKFGDVSRVAELLRTVIDSIQPTYDIEIRTVRELCSADSGISSLPNKSDQNVLIRRMMSVAPGERIPRHRLIRNLIDMGELEQAETEIRIFEKDFGKDGPVARYRILMMIGRAKETPGLMPEDRAAILEQARSFAKGATDRYRNNKAVLGVYCELGLEIFRQTASTVAFDDALATLKEADARVGDPEITRLVDRYSQRIWGK